MLVIFGVKLSKNKKIAYSLSQLYGIGLKCATRICWDLGLSPILKVEHLTERQQFQIIKKIKEQYLIESNLRELIKSDVQRYISNNSVRGFRHTHHLPVRGQRTHANARTPRRVIMGIPLRRNNK